MVMKCEAARSGKSRQRFVELVFDFRWHGDVEHRTAFFAHQVMVMADEIFGEFEAAELVVADDTRDDARRFENGKIAVHRTLRQVIGEALNVGDRDGPAG